MKELYIKALEAYINMLHIHIDTKSKDSDFHKETEMFYTTLFDIAHNIGEKHVDLGGEIEGKQLIEQKQNAYNILVELKNHIEKYEKEADYISLGTEDLLGSSVNNIESLIGTSKSFLRK